MIAQTAWTLDNKKFRGDLKLQRNTNVLLDTKVAVDFQPFTHLKFSVHFTKSEYQELEIRWNNFANGEGKLSVEGEGFLKMKVNVRMAADPNTEVKKSFTFLKKDYFTNVDSNGFECKYLDYEDLYSMFSKVQNFLRLNFQFKIATFQFDYIIIFKIKVSFSFLGVQSDVKCFHINFFPF